jgi:hypothetical protein
VNITRVSDGSRTISLSVVEKNIWDRIDAQGTTLMHDAIMKFMTDRNAQYKSQDDRDIIEDINSMDSKDKDKIMDDIKKKKKR